MHSLTLFSDAFVTARIIYLFQITDWKTLIFKWAWIWKHGRIYIILLMNTLDGWIVRVPRQFLDADVTNQDTLDVLDETILKCSWSKKSLVFTLAMICQICLFYVYCTSELDFYILDAPASNRLTIEQRVSECLNFSTLVEYAIPSTSF